jgi:hypothetical protein
VAEIDNRIAAQREAAMGELESAPIEFQATCDVAQGGALLALPALLAAGMLDRSTVLDIGIETARHYAAIRLELKRAGTPIPANDVWIAALSRQHAFPVMSRDTHFDFVGGLRRRTW